MSCSSKYQQLKEYIKSKRDAYQDLLDHIDKLDNPSVSLSDGYDYDPIEFPAPDNQYSYDLNTSLISDLPPDNLYAADTVSFDFGSGDDIIFSGISTSTDDPMVDLS